MGGEPLDLCYVSGIKADGSGSFDLYAFPEICYYTRWDIRMNKRLVEWTFQISI